MSKLRSWTRQNPVRIRDNTPRCESCNARLDLLTPWNWPHICKEVTYGTFVSPAKFIPLTGNS